MTEGRCFKLTRNTKFFNYIFSSHQLPAVVIDIPILRRLIGMIEMKNSVSSLLLL